MKRVNISKKVLLILIGAVSCSLLISCSGADRSKSGKSGSRYETDTESAVKEDDEKKQESDENHKNDESGKKADDYVASRDIFAMDTYMTVQAYGDSADEAVEQAIAEIERLDGMLSATDEESEIYELNRNEGGIVGEDVSYLIERAKEMYESTGGKFNIAIYPIVEKWGFASGEYYVPTEDELKELLKNTDFSQIEYNKEEKKVTYDSDGMKIDLGGIAKGYTSARIMDIFKNLGVTSGIVNLGGNVQVLGTKPDGSDWKVAIQHPMDANRYIGVLKTHDKAVITSGGYERYFEEDGITYHHIIDPDTGYPADSGLISVTIVCADGTMADCLSTSLFIMGKDKAIEYWKEHREEFDMILYTEDEELLVTEEIADKFASDFDMEIIK